MSWRMRVRHTTTYQYSAVVHASYNEARISPLDTPNQFTLEHRVEVHPAANLFRYRDYWGSRVHVVRPAPAAHRAHRGRVVAGGDGGAHAEPRRHGGVGRHRRAGPDRPVLRVPHRHHDDRVRRRHPAGGAGAAGDAGTGGGALRARRVAACARRVRDRHHERVDHRGRGAARRARACARTTRTSASRCSAPPASRPATRRATSTPTSSAGWWARCTRARATRGWRRGSATGIRSTRPAARPSPSVTCSSRGPRLLRRRAAQGRVPRRSEPLARRRGGADARRVGDEAEPCPEGGTVKRNRPSGEMKRSRAPRAGRWSGIGHRGRRRTATARFRGRRVVSPHVCPEPQCHGDASWSTAPRPSTRSRHGRCSCTTSARSSASPEPTSAATTTSCGACTVLLDGESVKSCTVLAAQADGRVGHHDRGPGRRRRAAPDAGRVPRAPRAPVRVLHAGHGDGGGRRSRPERGALDEDEVRMGLEGNLCRCTGYHNIVAAVVAGSAEMAG